MGYRDIRDELVIGSQRGEGGKGERKEEKEASVENREERRLRQCGVVTGREVGLKLERKKKSCVKFERTEMRLKREPPSYLITVTWLAEVHGLWVCDRPHAVSIVAIDSSKLLGL